MPHINTEARKAYQRDYYQRNKDKYGRLYRENREKLIALKKTLVCGRCGDSRHCVLDFHHRDPSSKRSAVTRMIGKYAWPTVLEEIAKCDVLCSNCHRVEHCTTE